MSCSQKNKEDGILYFIEEYLSLHINLKKLTMKYLNPRADLTFKRIFGEHPDLVISLLNALLPLKAGEEIREIEYLPSEMVPDNSIIREFIGGSVYDV